MRPEAQIDGIPVRQTSLTAAIDDFLDAAISGKCVAYRFVNSYSLALASKDRRYHRLLSDSGVNLPDGMPMAFALRRLGYRGVAQTRGPSFFGGCLDRGRLYGTRHFLLGGTPEVLCQLQAAAHHRFPGVSVVGAESPPFRELTAAEREEVDERIRSARPHVVWVGLGTPKQDFEAQRLSEQLDVCAAGVGAAFDFLAGAKPEAPAVLSRLGLEWLFRLATEPKRLWRRYLFGNAQFLIIAFQAWGRRKRCESR